jgi:hypothetical protein
VQEVLAVSVVDANPLSEVVALGRGLVSDPDIAAGRAHHAIADLPHDLVDLLQLKPDDRCPLQQLSSQPNDGLAVLKPRGYGWDRRARIDRRRQHLNVRPEHLELTVAR